MFEISPELQWILYGVLMILIVYFLPDGIVPAVRKWWRELEDSWGWSRSAVATRTGRGGR